jgi:hypothetical protein
MDELPDGAPLNELARPDPLGMVDDHVGLGHEEARAVPRLDQPVELGGVHGHGLFGEHVLARLDGLERPLQVEVVGERDVDRLDLRVGQERFVGGVDLQVRREVAKPLRLGVVRGGERKELGAAGHVDRGGHLLTREVRGAQDAPADGFRHVVPLRLRPRR